MQEKKKGNIASRVYDLVKETVEECGCMLWDVEFVKEAVEECGCMLWDVEFVKEGPDHNLIIYIDKPEGISLDDCEMVNDAVEPIIDEADPIEGSYYLEISSPGLERELKTPEHILSFIGERVIVKLYAQKDGKKAFDGTISGFDEESGTLTLDVSGTEVVLERKEYASIKTVCEF